MKTSKSFYLPRTERKTSAKGNVISTNRKVEPSTYMDMGSQKKKKFWCTVVFETFDKEISNSRGN